LKTEFTQKKITLRLFYANTRLRLHFVKLSSSVNSAFSYGRFSYCPFTFMAFL